MLPLHRPAMASTSNPSQMTTSAGVGVSMRTPDASPRIRKDATQEMRVGRHRDKLELIRDSLKPYEQACESDATAATQPTTNNNSYADNETRRQIMLQTLIQIGFDQEAANLALQLVRFSSVSAAAEVLLNIKKDHVFQQDLPLVTPMNNGFVLSNGLGNVPPSPYSVANNNVLSPSSRTAATNQTLGVQMQAGTSNGAALDDSGSSRSESPLAARIPSPPSSYAVHVPSPSQQGHPTANHHQISEYQRSSHPPLNQLYASRAVRNGYDYSEASSSHVGGLQPVGSARSVLSHSRKVEQTSAQNAATVINIERGRTPINEMLIRPSVSRALPNGTHAIRRTENLPMIRQRDRTPHRNNHNLVHINVDPSQTSDYLRSRYEINEEIAMHANSSGISGVQSILVDPETSPSTEFAKYACEIERQMKRMKPFADRDPLGPTASDPNPLSQGFDRKQILRPGRSSPTLPSTSSAPEKDSVVRCVSPLPEGIARRLRTNTYDSIVKPCTSRLFCFFMEQHVERLIQQYKERQQRAHQLAKEMECAELPDNMREQMMQFLIQKESRYLRLRRQKMNKNMFEVIKHIGFGAFGRVSLVRKKDTGQVYAMKTLLKKDVIMKQQAAHVKAERDILAEANSPWIVKLFFSFQDQQTLYFIMEYVPGGDMMQLLINKGIFYEKLARFYIAELTCAIEYVHKLGFIHRDIKPDNILIDQNGHLKLTDFGLCTGLRWTHDKRYYGPDNDEVENIHARQDSFAVPQQLLGRGRPAKVLDMRNHCKRNQSHSLVGTDNYMAPEVILGTGHTQLCDWWSVGVILYEMVFGRPPFMSEDRFETQVKIVNWRQYLDVSHRLRVKLSDQCIDMIRRLCCDQENRLGSENGAHDLKVHPWFEGIDFNILRSTRAEYIPRVEHAEDTSNFDTFDVDSSDQSFDTMAKRASASTASNPAFYEFTFRHFFDFDGQGCPSLKTQKRPSLAPVFETNGRNNNRKKVLQPFVAPPTTSQLSDEFESDDSLVV